ncbi:MAG: UDP-N-acetylmuramoyl-tripeptide--D-alanyl-D-alanine ligase [Candidatus Tyrphobacter sp.]
MSLPFEVGVDATNARVFESRRAPQMLRVATDTRTLQRGDTFLALRGDRFDGHDYIAQAIAAGAAALVVDREDARVPGVATLVVQDTLRAYMALAAAARARYAGRVVGITGSVGKTTTKVLLEQLLARSVRVLASPANENNEIGVSRLLLSASGKDLLIVEMGARKYGDIAALVEIAKPDVGILTNVGEAHLEIMGSRQRIEETKWALFSRGALAVLNVFDDASRRRATELSNRPQWFFAGAREPSDPPLPCCAIVGDDRLVLLRDEGRSERALDVRLAGAHNRENLAAALAGAIAVGAPLDALVDAVPSLHLPLGRFERVALSGVDFIYDAYNASATGTLASLDAFAQEPATRRIAVLGGMLELGEESESLHERVGAHAASCVQHLLAGGAFRHATARGALSAGLCAERIVEYEANGEAARWLREHVRPGDLVLLKGSRGYRLEEILAELRGQ